MKNFKSKEEFINEIYNSPSPFGETKDVEYRRSIEYFQRFNESNLLDEFIPDNNNVSKSSIGGVGQFLVYHTDNGDYYALMTEEEEEIFNKGGVSRGIIIGMLINRAIHKSEHDKLYPTKPYHSINRGSGHWLD